MDQISAFQGITLAIAAVGAILGVVNTWQALDRSRVKLKVTPAHAIPVGSVDPSISFCIEVTNLSLFPVTVIEAGVLYHDTQKRGAILNPILIDGGTWPRRLEPRTSVTVYAKPLLASGDGHMVRCAYARTQCGVLAKGTSPALRQIAQGIIQ